MFSSVNVIQPYTYFWALAEVAGINDPGPRTTTDGFVPLDHYFVWSFWDVPQSWLIVVREPALALHVPARGIEMLSLLRALGSLYWLMHIVPAFLGPK